MKYLRFLHNRKTRFGILDGVNIQVLSNTYFEPFEETSESLPLSEVRLLPPSIPSKIIAVGLNYKLHASEMHEDLPKAPKLFLKPSSAVIGSWDIIEKPEMSERVDYEAELAIVIGKTAKKVQEKDARDYIFGYTCFNDVTARDLQSLDVQWTRAKGFDTFAPVGPWIETELDPDNTDLSLIKNGAVMQKGTTSDFIFKTNTLVSFISHVMTLYPGDIITTGTPGGIGPMAEGDEIQVCIGGIGTLTNYFNFKP